MRLLRLFAASALLVSPTLLVAQGRDRESDAEWLEKCRDGRTWGDNDRGRACEVRNVPVKLNGRSISIDGQQNGGVRVFGWDRDEVELTARMQAQARTDAEARELLSRVRIVADGRGVRAEGPSTDRDDDGWSVSYYANVPRRFDLELTAHNGGLGVEGVSGKL
jgi:hypothetical protein